MKINCQNDPHLTKAVVNKLLELNYIISCSGSVKQNLIAGNWQYIYTQDRSISGINANGYTIDSLTVDEFFKNPPPPYNDVKYLDKEFFSSRPPCYLVHKERGTLYVPTLISDDIVTLGGMKYTWEDLYHKFTFVNGAPCYQQ